MNRHERPGEQRFPLRPLWDLACARTIVTFARMVGVHPRQVYRWKAKGLRFEDADRSAVAIGFLPNEVWVEWPTNVEARA